jgi:hypothetical protein
MVQRVGDQVARADILKRLREAVPQILEQQIGPPYRSPRGFIRVSLTTAPLADPSGATPTNLRNAAE